LSFLFAALALLANLGAPARVYDAAADFSAASNPGPGGLWSYGWEAKPGAELHIYTGRYATLYWGAHVTGWSKTGAGPRQGDFRSPSVAAASPAARSVGSPWTAKGASIPAGQIWFYPGPRGESSVVRWTCPNRGHYRMEVRFEAFGPAATDVYVLKNGAMLGQEEMGRGGFAHDFSFESLELRAGDYVDFAVSYGSGRTYEDGVTGLSVIIRELAEA
jgi:hypothetical protein